MKVRVSLFCDPYVLAAFSLPMPTTWISISMSLLLLFLIMLIAMKYMKWRGVLTGIYFAGLSNISLARADQS